MKRALERAFGYCGDHMALPVQDVAAALPFYQTVFGFAVVSQGEQLKANGLQEISEFNVEVHDDVAWKVFYVVAPDGLCYWFGERKTD
jgi:lactoylglutathione lyase